MAAFVAEVVVTPRAVVNDPQGLSVRDGLRRLGFDTVRGARVGKHIVLELDAPDAASAERLARAMCERLLRNPVIEDYRIEIHAPAAAGPG